MALVSKSIKDTIDLSSIEENTKKSGSVLREKTFDFLNVTVSRGTETENSIFNGTLVESTFHNERLSRLSFILNHTELCSFISCEGKINQVIFYSGKRKLREIISHLNYTISISQPKLMEPVYMISINF